MPLVLELRSRRPPKHDATLRIPAVAMEATGEGTWSGDRLRLTLSYGDGCPGTVEVDARVTDRGGEGTLSAHDCTEASRVRWCWCAAWPTTEPAQRFVESRASAA
jgi:hypothetical protein